MRIFSNKTVFQVLAVSGTAAGIIVLFIISFGFQRSFVLNLSPVPNRYVINFIDGLQQEEKSRTYYNWANDQSRINFPLRVCDSDVSVAMRLKRFINYQAYLFVYANGNRVFLKNIQGAKYERVRFIVPREYLEGEDLGLSFRILSNETKRKKGMRLDWIKITVPEEGSVRPTGEQFREFLLFLALSCVLVMLLRLSLRARLLCFFLPFLVFLIGNAFFRVETSLLIHYVNRLVYIPAIIMLLLGFSLQKFSRNTTPEKIRSWKLNFSIITLLFYIAQLFRVAGTYYYQYFYPDLRSYFKYMTVLHDEGIVGFSWWYAHHHIKILYHFETVFPYSPLYHIFVYPFTLVYNDYYFWLRFTSVTLNSLIVVIVYLITKRLFGSTSKAVFSALFIAFSPLMFHRLFLCMYAGLFSGFLMMALLLYLVWNRNKFTDLKTRWLGIALAALVMLSYPSAVLNLIIFILFFSAMLATSPKTKRFFMGLKFKPLAQFKPLRTIFIVGGAMAFFTYYVFFIHPLLTEFFPFLFRRGYATSWNQEAAQGFIEYLITRLRFYLSIPGILIFAPGVFLIFKKENLRNYEYRLLLSWMFTWIFTYLLAAPGILSSILRLGKEGLYAQPFFALASGCSLAWLWKRGSFWRALAVFAIAAYIGLSLYKWAANIGSFMVFIE